MASLNIPSVNNYITSKENANKYPQQIKCFETHPSITTITKQCQSFNFQKTNANEVMIIIKMQILLLKSLNLRKIFLQINAKRAQCSAMPSSYDRKIQRVYT